MYVNISHEPISVNRKDFGKALDCANDLGFSVNFQKDCDPYFDFSKSEIILNSFFI